MSAPIVQPADICHACMGEGQVEHDILDWYHSASEQPVYRQEWKTCDVCQGTGHEDGVDPGAM